MQTATEEVFREIAMHMGSGNIHSTLMEIQQKITNIK